jgi:hypothetical protein
MVHLNYISVALLVLSTYHFSHGGASLSVVRGLLSTRGHRPLPIPKSLIKPPLSTIKSRIYAVTTRSSVDYVHQSRSLPLLRGRALSILNAPSTVISTVRKRIQSCSMHFKYLRSIDTVIRDWERDVLASGQVTSPAYAILLTSVNDALCHSCFITVE